MATFTSITRHGATCPSPARLSIVQTVLRAAALWRSRRALADLSEDQLKDIGLSAEEAEREAKRAIWDAPSHWYR